MPRRTIHDQLVDALVARGYRVATNSRTRRYTELVKEGHRSFFVGRSGALRAGRTVSKSMSCSHLKRVLLES